MALSHLATLENIKTNSEEVFLSWYCGIFQIMEKSCKEN